MSLFERRWQCFLVWFSTANRFTSEYSKELSLFLKLYHLRPRIHFSPGKSSGEDYLKPKQVSLVEVLS